MKKNALAVFELEVFFGSSLGCRAWAPDNGGLNTPSPDREAHVTDRWIDEVSQHRRVRARLDLLDSAHVVVLARAFQIARPLPPPVLREWGGDEPVARIAMAIDERSKPRAVEVATAALAEALDSYASVRRGGPASPATPLPLTTGAPATSHSAERTWVPTAKGRGVWLSPREKERARLLAVLHRATKEAA